MDMDNDFLLLAQTPPTLEGSDIMSYGAHQWSIFGHSFFVEF